jgi:hypothetical protein
VQPRSEPSGSDPLSVLRCLNPPSLSPRNRPAGRDLSRALQLRAPGSQERLYGWYGRGWRCAYDVAKALNFLHSKARGLPMRLKGGPPCALQSSAAGGSEV